jgi:hypothetical protein
MGQNAAPRRPLQLYSKPHGWDRTRLGILAALCFTPLLVAVGWWNVKILKDKQPWRSWAIYRAFIAAKETFSGKR